MKQISQNYKSGMVRLESVGKQRAKSGGVLVATRFSVVSIGTESMKVSEGRLSLVGMARARPDHVKKVLESVRQQGIKATYDKVMNRLDSLTPLGYSLSGEVVEVGSDVADICVGQRVACAGAGYANHAGLNFVPRNLCVPIPDGISMEHAAFATVGSIALHGYRQANMQLGETACIVGLGLIGQMLNQILVAAGITVFGFDLDDSRCELARKCGATAAGKPDDPMVGNAIARLTHGSGVDRVFITAGGASNQPVEIAAKVARDRAQIIDIGKTTLDLPWTEYYEKELEVRFSRSYGPGRYDSNYEERGVDYPIGYVRWTERRNLYAFLELIRRNSIDLSVLISKVIQFEDAEDFYSGIGSKDASYLGVVFDHGSRENPQHADDFSSWVVAERPSLPGRMSGRVRLGVIGAGNYASTMLLPHLSKDTRVSLDYVATSKGLSAQSAAKRFGFSRATTDYNDILASDEIDTILIATRHSMHAELTCSALEQGKTVYCEKPLALSYQQLSRVVSTARRTQNDRVMVGFNRRFSPLVLKLKSSIVGIGPLAMHYRVHAGKLESSSWYIDRDEGGRFVGEAGHFFDVMSFLCESRPVEVVAYTLRPAETLSDDLDNTAVLVRYADGSIGNLLYLTQGGIKTPKEHLEVFGNGTACILQNFKQLDIYQGETHTVHKSKSIDKGQKNQLKQFVDSLCHERSLPIRFMDIADTTALTLAARDSLSRGIAIRLSEVWDHVLGDEALQITE